MSIAFVRAVGRVLSVCRDRVSGTRDDAVWVGRATRTARLATGVAVAAAAFTMMTPTTASAQSAGCTAVNNGGLDFRAVYVNNALDTAQSTARFEGGAVGSNVGIHAIRTVAGTTDQLAGTAAYLDGGTPYPFAAGDMIELTAIVSGYSAGTLTGTFRNGNSPTTTAESQSFSATANGTFTRSYTVTGSETSIGFRALEQGGTSTGTIDFAVACTSATPPTPTINSIAPTGGSSGGGTPVTITGTNFASNNAYTSTFGPSTVPATFTSATTLIATTPAGTGTVAVTVTDTTTSQAATGSLTYAYAAPTVSALSVTSGPANQSRAVTITGTNFTPSATVSVDGVSATGVTFVSATQLNATLPGRPAGTYSVRVTTGSVTSAANPPADQYTYVAAPTVTSVTPNSGTTAGGTNVTISGSNLTGASSVTFGGTAAGSVVVASDGGSITAATPARAAGAVNVAVTTPGGTGTLVNGFTYVVLTAPAVTTQPANQTVAVGATATFAAAAAGSPTPTVQWQLSTDGNPFTDIAGATASSYTTPATTAADNGNRYRAVFTNSQGTATTNAATLTVVQAPTANAESVTVPFNTATAITLTGTDPNAPPRTLVYSVLTAPAQGTLTGTAPNLTYTPNPNVRGTDTFTFRVGNGVANSAPATVSITVSDPVLAIAGTPPAGQRGAAYDFQFSTSGGTGSYAYSITTGALPAGLTLSSAGRITGTPTASGSFAATVTVRDAGLGDPVTQSQPITIVVAAPALSASPPAGALPGGTVGVAYSQTFNTSGGTSPYAYTLASGSLPAGMTLGANGSLSGVPTQAGGFTFSITATDSSTAESGGPYALTSAYSLNVQAATIAVTPASVPPSTVGAAYSFDLGATGGTAPYTFAVTAGALPSGVSLDAAGVLSGTPTAGGSFDFTVTATDSSSGTGAPFTGSRAYTMTVGAPTIVLAPGALPPATGGQPYSQTLTASGGTAPYVFSTAGPLPAGVTLSSAGVLSGTPSVDGSFEFTVTALDSSTGGPNPGGRYAGSAVYTLSVDAPTIAIAPVTLPEGTVAAAYAQTLTAGGGVGSYEFTVAAGALPAGLTLTLEGALSGTPTAGGSFGFTVRAADDNGFAGTQVYELVIGAPTIAIAPATIPDATRNVAYSQTLVASGGTAPYAYAVTAGALPAGVALASNGTLSGTPTAGGTFDFTVTATDSSTGTGPYAGSLAYGLTVVVPDIQIAPATLAQATTRVAYTQTLTATGGAAPYAFTVTAGALPAGITLAADGTLAGTTTQAGTFGFTATASDVNGNAGEGAYSLVVETPTIAIAPATLAQATTRVAYTQTLTATGGTAPYAFTVTAGALPAGITLAADGTLAGTTTQAGTFGFTATATDVNGNTGEEAYSLMIATPAIAIAPTSLPAGTAGLAYDQTLNATGGASPYTYAVTAGALPAGIILASDGSLSGATADTGSFAFTATASDADGNTGEQAYTLVIGAPQVAIAPASLPNGTGSTAYLQTLTASGGVAPYVFTATGTLPSGLSLSADGTLSGTPTQSGSFDFTVTATDANGFSGSADYTVLIDAPVIALAPGTLPAAVIGSPYNQAITASGGTAPYGFVLAEGTLPDGLALGTDGVLSGTPTTGGTFEIVVQASDANEFAGAANYTLRVEGQLPVAADTTVTVLAGTSVTVDLTSGAAGGPFTGAAIVAQADPRIGSATLDRGGVGTSLVFAANPAAGGRTSVSYTLSNAFGSSNVATITVLVEARPDPSLDPEVVGLLGAQADSTRRIASAQIRNFRDRLERTHDEDERRQGSTNISVGLPSETSANDPIALFQDENDRALTERFDSFEDTSGRDRAASQRNPATGAGEGPRSNAAFWAGGFVNFGSRDVDEVSIDLDRTLVGLSAGVDYRFTPQFVGGVGIGYGRERADIGENGTTSRAEAYSGVVYGSYAPGASLFLDGLVGYSRLEFDSLRFVTATGDFALGERSGDQMFGSLTATYEHRGEGHLFAPYLGVEGSHARLDAFTEAGDGAFMLTFGNQDVTSLAGILGLRLEADVAFDWGVLTPRARVEYSHDFAQSDRASIGYADIGTLAYGLRSDIDSRDRLEFGLGFDSAFVDGWSLAFDYRPALGLDGGQRDHSVAVQVRRSF